MAIATMGNERIIITGFMGSGKSTVGRALARLLECEMVDLDEVITHEDRAPWQIIEADGEPAFRVIETRALGNALEVSSARVIALGGGTWILQRNRDLIKSHSAVIVWLDAPFTTCWARIQECRGNRPLAPTEAGAQVLYDKRRAVYELADLVITVDHNKTTDDIAAEIVAQITQAPATRQT
ncbi:MAG: shikimate kinase [Acidobacteriota bacterium]